MFQTRDSGADDRSQILHAEGLRKVYGARTALKNLSFSLQAGRVVGFLGPNGAGKTTSIRILTTILQPSSGHFVVDGISSDHPEEIRRRIGVLPEGLGFPRQLTGLRTSRLARSNAIAIARSLALSFLLRRAASAQSTKIDSESSQSSVR